MNASFRPNLMRILFIGSLMISVIAACGNLAAPIPSPTPVPTLHTATATGIKEPSDIEYSSVAEALAGLKTRKDVSISILQGWTIATQSDGLTNWSFPPPDHPAYPAVAKRVLYRDQDGWHLTMDILCEAKAADCDEFVRYFELMNEPIHQLSEQQ